MAIPTRNEIVELIGDPTIIAFFDKTQGYGPSLAHQYLTVVGRGIEIKLQLFCIQVYFDGPDLLPKIVGHKKTDLMAPKAFRGIEKGEVSKVDGVIRIVLDIVPARPRNLAIALGNVVGKGIIDIGGISAGSDVEIELCPLVDKYLVALRIATESERNIGHLDLYAVPFHLAIAVANIKVIIPPKNRTVS